MPKKKKFQNKYTSMTVIGKSVGLSGRAVGDKLKEAGLRQADGTPSKEALDSGIAVFTPLKDGTKHWMWSRKAVIRKLEENGVDTSYETRHFFKVREVVQEALNLGSSDNDKLARLGFEAWEGELAPTIDKEIRWNLPLVRKAIHQAKGSRESKGWLLEWMLVRHLMLAAGSDTELDINDVGYVIDKASDWRTVEEVVTLPGCNQFLANRAIQRMEELGAPEHVVERLVGNLKHEI